MNKPILTIALLLLTLCFLKANAQVDTGYLDLGRMHLKKNFTQSITIKGSDLERMPFENLGEAINVWFYGNYTNSPNLVYIIDGNLANDVNAYSIYDIEEVTLVQNALTQLNGTAQQQQLVLIKTKRPKAKGFGITANGQASLTNLYTNNVPSGNDNGYQTGLKSTTTIYQQYNISAYKNTDNIQFGISADYMGDVQALIEQPTIAYSTKPQLNRFRYNGYFDAKIGSSLLDVTAGYAPEKIKEALTSDYTTPTPQQVDGSYYDKEQMYNGSIKLTSPIVKGLNNVFHGDYNDYRASEQQAYADEDGNYSSGSVGNSVTRNHNIVVYDNLGYDLRFGNWEFSPEANLNFRTFKQYTASTELSLYTNGENSSTSSATYSEHLFVLTPSVNLYYKTWFNIGAGFADNLSETQSMNIATGTMKKLFPFATATADVSHLIDPTSSFTVKLFGSYSQSYSLGDNASTLHDYTNQYEQVPEITGEGTLSVPFGGTVNYGNYEYELQLDNKAGKSFNSFAAGLSVSPNSNSLVFSYFFDRSNYLSPIYVPEAFGGNETIEEVYYDNTSAFLHRLGLDYNLVDGPSINWHTGINATLIKQKFEVSYGPEPATGANEWTGGWVNRVNYHNVFAGLDVLYEVGEKLYTATAPTYTPVGSTINSFSLQNVYAGYRVKVSPLKDLEIYANARNLFQNKKEDITDSRKYYGLGFKLSL